VAVLASTLPGVSAPQLFDQMLKTHIAPSLRALGMRGSGQNYSLPNPAGDYALIGFQKDRYNTAQLCRFTLNTAFYRKLAWQQARDRESWLPAAPTATSVFGVAGWQDRVGTLLDPPHDHWWVIATPADVTLVADQVTTVVRAVVLPQLTARLAGTQPPPLPRVSAGPARACPWLPCSY
jgi:hypothetical protein